MATLDTRAHVTRNPDAVEPTFYLGGQPYIYDHEELCKAGPELAERAFYETWRELWRLFAQRCGGEVSQTDFETRAAELYEGAWHLRRLIPRSERLIPNGHFTQQH